MKKCKKKDGLIYDFEVAEIKKVEYRIYLNNDFVCAMDEKEFKENFEIIEENTENTNTSYSAILKEFVNSEYNGEKAFWERAGAKREFIDVLLLLGRYKLTHLTEEFCKAILDKYKIPYEKNTKVKKEEEEVSYVVKPVDWHRAFGIDYMDKNFKEKVYSMIPSDESKMDYKEDLKAIKEMIRERRKKSIIDIIQYKEIEIDHNQEFLSKSLKIPLARPLSQYVSDEIRKIKSEIEAFKNALERLDENIKEDDDTTKKLIEIDRKIKELHDEKMQK